MESIKIAQLSQMYKDFYVIPFWLKSEYEITYWDIMIRAEWTCR